MSEEIDIDMVTEDSFETNYFVAKPYRVKAVKMDRPFRYTYKGQPKHGKTGDYVVFMENGPMGMSEKDFEHAFMPVYEMGK